MLQVSRTPEQLRQDSGMNGLVQTMQDVRARITQLIVEIDHEELLDIAIKMMEEVQHCLEWHASKLKGKPFKVTELVIPSAIYRLMEKKGGDDTKEGDSDDLKLAKQLSLQEAQKSDQKSGDNKDGGGVRRPDDDDDDDDQKNPTQLSEQEVPVVAPRETKEKKKISWIRT
jgi:hypothetical protein